MKTAKENLIDVCKDKKILFLENDLSLQHGLDDVENIFKENKIEYKCLFDLMSKYTFEQVINEIENHDIIVFQTQWVYELSHKLREYLFNSKNSKIVIECYINDPTWYYKPDVIHDVYVFKGIMNKFEIPIQDEIRKFYKLSDKPYWDYKNKFDK